MYPRGLDDNPLPPCGRPLWGFSQTTSQRLAGNRALRNFIQKIFKQENIQPEDFQAGKLTIQKSKKQEN